MLLFDRLTLSVAIFLKNNYFKLQMLNLRRPFAIDINLQMTVKVLGSPNLQSDTFS